MQNTRASASLVAAGEPLQNPESANGASEVNGDGLAAPRGDLPADPPEGPPAGSVATSRRESPRKGNGSIKRYSPPLPAASPIAKAKEGSKERGQGRFRQNIVIATLSRAVVLYLASGNLQTYRLAKPGTQETNSKQVRSSAARRLTEELVYVVGVPVECLVLRSFFGDLECTGFLKDKKLPLSRQLCLSVVRAALDSRVGNVSKTVTDRALTVVDNVGKRYVAAENKVNGGRNTGGDRSTDLLLWGKHFTPRTTEVYSTLIDDAGSMFGNKLHHTMPEAVELGSFARKVGYSARPGPGAGLVSQPKPRGALVAFTNNGSDTQRQTGTLGSSLAAASGGDAGKAPWPNHGIRSGTTVPQREVETAGRILASLTEAPATNIDLNVARGEADDSPGISGQAEDDDELNLLAAPSPSSSLGEDLASAVVDTHAGMAEVATSVFETPRQPQPAPQAQPAAQAPQVQDAPEAEYAQPARVKRAKQTAASRAAKAAEVEMARRQAAARAAHAKKVGAPNPEPGSQKPPAADSEDAGGISRVLFAMQENERIRGDAASSARHEELKIAQGELDVKRESMSLLKEKNKQDNLCTLLERNIPDAAKRMMLVRYYDFSETEALCMVPHDG